MNYLAHLLLAGDNPQHQLGGFIADFVRGQLTTLASHYPGPVLKGIADHRKIDSFTDSHPVFYTSRMRVSPERRRVAGIIIDIAYDHFLSVHWDRFCATPRQEFISSAYRLLEENCDLLPERLRLIAPRMIDHDWLGSYRELRILGLAFDRMSQRMRRSNQLQGALVEVEREYQELENDFLRFFPAAMQFAESE
jgi:acyl carrier protein phosphodiesterase